MVCSFLDNTAHLCGHCSRALRRGSLGCQYLGLVLGGLGLEELADVCQRVEKRGAGCDVEHGP
jgi:hypothetical protein